MQVHVVFIDPVSGEVLTEGNLVVKGGTPKQVMHSCQKMFGPCRGYDANSGFYRFLSGDGILVRVHI